MSAFHPLPTFAHQTIISTMTNEVPALWWAAPLGLAGLRKRSDLRRSMEAYWRNTLDWRWSEPADWPSTTPLWGNFSHAKKGGFGFVADLGSKRLFAVPRGWEEPEWQLAEISSADGRWRDLGCFEPWSPSWVRPEPTAHPSRKVGKRP